MADGFVIVHAPAGSFRGKRQVSEVTNETFRSYQGIPYAKPPVGPLRFQPPQKLERLEGIHDSLCEGSSSHGYAMMQDGIQENTNEDCLYLNVFTPDQDQESREELEERWPVLFYIHGGGFNAGSGNIQLHGPDYIVSKKVLVVTINYRLGALGFLSLKNTKCPGNNGLKDMVAALKWVQKNIGSFGGDPKNVTICGQSAGAASVHFLMLSPMASGLFHRGISMSGTAFNPTATVKDPRKNAFCLGKLLGIDTEDDAELLEELKKVPAQDFVTLSMKVKQLTEPDDYFIPFGFTPVIEIDHEGAFISKHPHQLLSDEKLTDVPYMFGSCNMEGLVAADGDENLIKGDNYEDYARIFPPKLRRAMGVDLANGIRSLKEHFFPQGFNKPAFIKAISPRYYWSGIDMAIRYNLSIQARKSPTYLYYFTYDGACNVYKKAIGCGHYPGASHADDLGYFFYCNQFGLPAAEAGSAEQKVTHILTSFLTNFMKYGEPTPKGREPTGLLWPPVTINEMCCMEICPEPKIQLDPEGKDIEFWRKLYQQYDVKI